MGSNWIQQQNVGLNALGDPDSRVLHRILRQMCIARGRFDLRMAEKSADHRKTFAERQRSGCVAVSAIVNAHVFQPGLFADDVPWLVQVARLLALDLDRNDERIVMNARDRRQLPRRFGRQRDRSRTGLGIRQPQLVRLESHLVPAQV